MSTLIHTEAFVAAVREERILVPLKHGGRLLSTEAGLMRELCFIGSGGEALKAHIIIPTPASKLPSPRKTPESAGKRR